MTTPKSDIFNNVKHIEKIESKLNLDSIEAKNSETEKLKNNEINRIVVSEKDSSMLITANMKLDHRIFGYEKPNSNSQKLILISIFTADVEGNPFQFPLGAFYDTSGMENIKIKFLGFEHSFVKAEFIKSDKIVTILFFEKKWVEFEKD